MGVVTVWLWTVAPLLALHLWIGWRWRELLRFQLILDIILAVVVGPALVGGADLNPVRCLEGDRPFTEWPWSNTSQLQPTQSDLVLQFHPWWEETWRQLRVGRMPWISERIGGGLPLLANGQTGIWAPLNLPVWVLGVERGSTVMAMWKVELAGLGAFLFLWRNWRLHRWAAEVGGVAFAGGAYLTAWLLVPLAWVVAALPWAWWGTAAALRGRLRACRLIGLGLLFGCLLGCGLHPETATIVVGSALLAGLVIHPRKWLRLAALLALALMVGALLAWPTLAYIEVSEKLTILEDVRVNLERPPLAVRLRAMQQLLVPMSLGHPGRGDWRGAYPYSAGATGVGGLALALLATGKARRRHRRLLWAVLASLAVAAVIVYRIPPLDTLLVRLPPIDRMTLPRFAVLASWALAAMSALAADGAVRGRCRSPAWAALAIGALAVVVAAAAPWRLQTTSFALVLATVFAGTLARPLLRRPRLLAPALAVELGLYALGINPTAAVEDRLPTPPLIERLREHQAERGGRVIGLDGALPPNLAARYGIPDLRAYDPLRPRHFVELMAALGDRNAMLGGPLRVAPPRLCGAWSVRYLVCPPAAEPAGWEPVWSDGSGAIWSNPHWLSELRVVGLAHPLGDEDGWQLLAGEQLDFAREAVVPEGTVAVAATHVELVESTSSGPRLLATVRCDGPCLVVAARPWAPGWRAVVDGKRAPLVRANLAGLGVVSPPGKHTVELRYNPWRWWPGEG